MSKRLVGALYLIPLLMAFYVGGIALKIVALALSIVGVCEFYKAFKQKDVNADCLVGVVLCVVEFIFMILGIKHNYLKIALVMLFFVSIVLVLINKHTILDIIITWFGAIYVVFPISEFVSLYESKSDGRQLTALIFIIAFSTDIFAYLVGCKFGKHKLIPKISPNKTIEGSVGAMIATIIITLLYCMMVGLNLGTWIVVLIAIIGSTLGQIGDLFASSIKRYCGIKDFGNLIPGHGGVLDRFDSVLFVSLWMSIVAMVLA